MTLNNWTLELVMIEHYVGRGGRKSSDVIYERSLNVLVFLVVKLQSNYFLTHRCR